MLKEITRKVLRYSDIPYEVKKMDHLDDSVCHSYIVFEIREEGTSELDDWLREKYPELIGEEFLIHIDC